jgi:hypothetical protein
MAVSFSASRNGRHLPRINVMALIYWRLSRLEGYGAAARIRSTEKSNDRDRKRISGVFKGYAIRTSGRQGLRLALRKRLGRLGLIYLSPEDGKR